MEQLIKGFLTKRIVILLQVSSVEDPLSISLDAEKAYEIIQRMILRGACIQEIKLKNDMAKVIMSISEEDIFN